MIRMGKNQPWKGIVVRMGKNRPWKAIVWAIAGSVLWGAASPAAAQFDLFGGNQQGMGAGLTEPPVTVEAQFTLATDGQPARLFVTAKIAPGWHIYAITQPAGGPVATRIQPEASAAYRLTGPFEADREPQRKREPAFNNLVVETFETEVTWYAPLEFTAKAEPGRLMIAGVVRAQPCDAGSCLPPTEYPFVARLGAGVAIPQPEPVTVSAEFTPAHGGQSAQLAVTARLQPGWHIYSLTQPPGGPLATVIQLDPATPVRLTGSFDADRPPQRTSEPAFNGLTVETFEDEVTWRAPLERNAGVDWAGLEIAGFVRAQPCSDSGCLMPTPYPFVAKMAEGALSAPPRAEAESAAPPTEPPAVTPPGAPEGVAAVTAPVQFDPAVVEVRDEGTSQQLSAPAALLLAFVGGLILNLMPCVLPVIGLKILAFVEQAGQSRAQSFWLNLWYSLGLISVFMVLAGLAIALGMGWGELFSLQGFNIALAGIVFAFGLSFLGVWEIPIPGFVSSGAANQWARKEGLAGAFAKGILTTVLATPCSAPALGTALAWMVGKPAPVTLAVFGAAGLGMASPYLLIGAFPELMRFMPKPGAWMDTFKHVMGFVLLGTVVYIFTFISTPNMVPTLGLLIGVWAAVWWIGRTPLYAELPERLKAWGQGIAFAALVWVFMFPGIPVKLPFLPNGVGSLLDVTRARYEWDMAERTATAQPQARNGHLDWQPFTRQRFEELVGSNQTVLVDFTADWCLTCKTLEALYLDTAATREAIDAHRMATLQADWTDGNPEVTAMLNALGSKQVPVIAIFPAGNPNSPVVLRGGYTQASLLEAIGRAVAYKGA